MIVRKEVHRILYKQQRYDKDGVMLNDYFKKKFLAAGNKALWFI